ncbi:L-aspartate oxidase [Microbacterium sp. p3-SID336]|uniref:L-aspartate oxidase n=1 Tax=Microbacterium sp. p3-SID336 TaxID=2916212 RepID=UPI0021A7DD9E|nr:L-aspartate oxidase [Microbacterium sp. p3-SID336]MCT1478530.1 L-aspartate oxidase [Microbacterium sp. p3-SID336]
MNVVVVGTGIAGLTAALHAHEKGHAVTVVTKGTLGEGCTLFAQGGIAGSHGQGDSPAAHAADTLAAAAGLADPAAVDVLVRASGERIAELAARGVAFDRAADGTLLRGREAAHSHARVAHAGGDATGAAISVALTAAVPRAGIVVLPHTLLTDLVVDDGAVAGVRVLTGDAISTIAADAVVLATGGAGQLYSRTTNPADVTGDGIAAALRAGAAVADLEFVQFHPTVLATGPAFLISEAVRGEGAVLRDAAGRRFVFDHHPDGELAPRDVVARAIASQAARQESPVLLDATALGRATLARRFPTIDRTTRERGYDWSREPLPVTPAAHFLMGGIATDLDGRTSLPGLYAVGEVARTGVHGANRLASNSLLEGAVFGARAAAALGTPWPRAEAPATTAPATTAPATEAPATEAPATEAPATEAPATEALAGAIAPQTPAIPFSRSALQQLMWDEVGLSRTAEGLQRALTLLRAWASAPRQPRTAREHEDANLLVVAEATAAAALARHRSVGAHHRADAATRAPEGRSRPDAVAPAPTAGAAPAPAARTAGSTLAPAVRPETDATPAQPRAARPPILETV